MTIADNPADPSTTRPGPVGSAQDRTPAPTGSAPGPVHPAPVRVLHWTNAAAIITMIGSGLAIYNADPILPFAMPSWLTIGGDLTGALKWHLAAMWALGGGMLSYLAIGFATGRFRARLWPISLAGVWRDTRAALLGRLSHDDLSTYNNVQRLLYAGVIATGCLAIASGLALWKPVQFAPLVMLLGDFDNARVVHFACMTLIAGFALVHVPMALLVPRTIRLMTLGGSR